MTPISIYDMDKTITRKATFLPFLIYAVPKHKWWRVIFTPLLIITSLAYALKIIDRGALKALNLKLMLGSEIDGNALESLSRGFADHVMKTNILPKALARIQQEKAEGRKLVLASASYAFYVKQVGTLCGFDASIGTKATKVGGSINGTIDGENCYGAAKLAMVINWLASEGIDRKSAHIRFYSDHVSDAYCMDWADEAFATNPHAPLRAMAAEKGWEIFEWR